MNLWYFGCFGVFFERIKIFQKTLARRALIGKIVKAFRVAEEATG
jgi:hypothetical protein